ncbi:MAG: presenilin family intramembrane aspartyl protease [Candidatus Woesearchaeota archaeon]
MKHEFKVTLILVFIFFLSQLIGLAFIAADIDNLTISDTGELVVVHPETVIGERPEFNGGQSLIYIIIGVLIGTLLLLFLAKYKAKKIWKFWYILAVIMTVSISLGVILSAQIALILAIIIATIKILKPNIYTHNITEVLMYSGLAIFLVPLFDLFWISIVLILISIYDMYAVWKSKHMITLAKFTAESNMFAGLTINYEANKIKQSHKKINLKNSTKNKSKTAILGGGDVVFPLLFTGVVMENLIKNGFSIINSYLFVLPIIIITTLALFLLFYYSKKGKFYPAMPFISMGCFLGAIFSWLLIFLI